VIRGLGIPLTLVGRAGSFRRNALVLTGGTFAAQALPLLLYPVFTRLYSPVEFGVFATISMFGTIAAILASGGYEHTILIARSRRVAAHLAAYSLLRSSVLLGTLMLMILPLPGVLPRLGVDPAIAPWVPIVPLIAAAAVIYNCYSEWCVRSQYFGELSKVRIWQTSVIQVARLALGVLTPAINGFVAGDALGKAASGVRCGQMLWRRDRPYLLIHSVAKARAAARRYAHVARYTLPDQLINYLGGTVHVLFLGAAFGTAQLGYVSIVLSAMYVPVTVVSSAVKDVFRQRASIEYAKYGTCRHSYRRLLVPIAVLAFGAFGILYAISPTLFPLVLGPTWALAGEYARILTPLFFCNFVAMSLGGVLVIAERSDVSLLWQVATLVLTVAALVVGTRVLNNMAAALWCYTLVRSASYLLYMALSYYYAERKPASV
jgi:O-antigen/teichoic acid export membrane protein